jgi:peptide/nickel transport system substrate-binding protein
MSDATDEATQSNLGPGSKTWPCLGRVLSRRELLKQGARLAVTATVGGGVLAACGGSPAVHPAGKHPKAALTTLTMAAGTDQWPESGSGVKSTTYQYPFNVNVFDTLIHMDHTFGLVPSLARSWELRPPNTWRFHLRPGVLFHDGSPLTSADVVYSMHRAAEGGQGSFSLIGPSSARALDTLTVDITPTGPNLHLPLQIVHPELSIMKNGTQASDGMGTGPFAATSYTPNEKVVVTRVPDYWAGPAMVSTLTALFVSDPNARLLALRSGQVDVALDPPPSSLSSLSTYGLTSTHSGVGETLLGYLNIHGSAPYDLLSDPVLRHALSLSISREKLAADVLTGVATPDPAMGPLSVLGPAAKDIKAVHHNHARATALLDQDGYAAGTDGIRSKRGRRLSLALIGWPTIDLSAMEFIQSSAKAVGIEVNIHNVPDFTSYGALRKAGKFDINLELPNQNDADPSFLPVLRFYSKSKSPAVALVAPGASFDAMVETTLATSDIAAIQRDSAELMNTLVYDDAIVIAYAGLWRVAAMKLAVGGLVLHPSETSQLWTKVYLR